jgi:hypothetical protein
MPRPFLTATTGLALAALLPACVGSAGGSAGGGGTPQVAQAVSGPCDISKAAFAMGRPWSDGLGDELKAATGAATVRVIPHGMGATMDFQEDRLTVSLDPAGAVERVSCG